MLSLTQIFRNNAETFYNYRTGECVNIIPRYTAILAASLAMALFFNAQVSDLYASIIAVQAILVGFSFNVLVYLASSDMIVVEGASIEKSTKAKKLNALSEEIFDNLSYFNVVALFSIFLSLLLIGASAFTLNVSTHMADLVSDVPGNVLAWGGVVRTIIRFAIILFTYATVLESLATFLRITRRVTYFFTQKRTIGREGESAAG